MSSSAAISEHVEATRKRGLHVPRGLPFVLPYLPFLIVFGIAPTVYALDLAFTDVGGGWVGFDNFTRTYHDFRFGPAFKHVLLYTSVWLAALMDQLAVLLRPQRAAWAALATLWIVIMLLNRSGDSDATTAMTASIPAAQARMALQQKQFLMVELAGHTDLRAAAQPQAVSPGPRSQRREGAAAA